MGRSWGNSRKIPESTGTALTQSFSWNPPSWYGSEPPSPASRAFPEFSPRQCGFGDSSFSEAVSPIALFTEAVSERAFSRLVVEFPAVLRIFFWAWPCLQSLVSKRKFHSVLGWAMHAFIESAGETFESKEGGRGTNIEKKDASFLLTVEVFLLTVQTQFPDGGNHKQKRPNPISRWGEP